MNLIFNELSLSSPAENKYISLKLIDNFISAFRGAVELGYDSAIVVNENFWNLLLSDCYTIYDWLTDPNVDIEMKRLIRTSTTRLKHTEQFLEENSERVIEVRHNDIRGIGFELAILWDQTVISFAFTDWEIDEISVNIYQVTNGNSIIKDYSIINIYDRENVYRYRNWIIERLQKEFKSGEDILIKQRDHLALLEFTVSAEDNLRLLKGTETVFKFVIRHLFALNNQAQNSGAANFMDGFRFPFSDDSEATLNKYGKEREFLCKDRIKRVFSLHTKIGPDAWRIYFLVENNRIIIGYIGKHLRTVENSN